MKKEQLFSLQLERFFFSLHKRLILRGSLGPNVLPKEGGHDRLEEAAAGVVRAGDLSHVVLALNSDEFVNNYDVYCEIRTPPPKEKNRTLPLQFCPLMINFTTRSLT